MYNFSKLAETSKDSKNEKIMIIIKELFVNFPRFHRDFDHDYDHDYDFIKG